MPFKMSVYQSKEYKSALIDSGIKVIDIEKKYFAVEKTV